MNGTEEKLGKNEFCFWNTKAGNFCAFYFCGIIIFRSPSTPPPLLPHNITDAASDCLRILRNTQCVGRGGKWEGPPCLPPFGQEPLLLFFPFFRMRKPKGNSGNGSRSPTRFFFFFDIQNCIWGTQIFFGHRCYFRNAKCTYACIF